MPIATPSDAVGAIPRRWRRDALVGASTALLAGSLALLGAEVLWTARRRLPSLQGIDASGPVPGTAPDDDPIRLVALGDSTLTGPGLNDPDDIWLRRSLAELRLERTVDVVSLAVGGSRVADVRAAVPEAIALDPHVVVVAVGSNDAIHGTGFRAFTEALDTVVAALLTQASAVAVCNVGDLGNVARVPMPLSSLLRQRSIAISRRIATVVAKHEGAVLLDVSASNVGFRDRGVFAEDLFHPNATGHALWAQAAQPGLREVLAGLAAPPVGKRGA
ncbi:MAG: SGNH/GDSL hydrolase family protein [Aquihabitans sp.]